MKNIFFILIFNIAILNLFAQSKAELENRKESAQREISNAKQMLTNTQRQKENSLKRLKILNSSIGSRERMLLTIDEEIDLLNELIDSLNVLVNTTQISINKGREEYKNIILSIYKNHTDEEKLMFLFASKDLNEFYQRMKYVKYLNDYRKTKIRELENLLKFYDARVEELSLRKDQKSQLLIEKSEETRQLILEKEKRFALVNRLAQDERELRAQIKKNERISKELDDKIQAMIEAEAKKHVSRDLFSALTPEQKIIGQSFHANKGRLPWPVERGIVTTKYGLINHPVLSGVKISNNGIDISSSVGSTARAVFDGEVTGVSAILGANYVVLIMHGEYISVYQNLVDLKVKVGDKVLRKQELGTIHSDANEGVAVLHLQIRKQRDALNPEEWLSK